MQGRTVPAPLWPCPPSPCGGLCRHGTLRAPPGAERPRVPARCQQQPPTGQRLAGRDVTGSTRQRRLQLLHSTAQTCVSPALACGKLRGQARDLFSFQKHGCSWMIKRWLVSEAGAGDTASGCSFVNWFRCLLCQVSVPAQKLVCVNQLRLGLFWAPRARDVCTRWGCTGCAAGLGHQHRAGGFSAPSRHHGRGQRRQQRPTGQRQSQGRGSGVGTAGCHGVRDNGHPMEQSVLTQLQGCGGWG